VGSLFAGKHRPVLRLLVARTLATCLLFHSQTPSLIPMQSLPPKQLALPHSHRSLTALPAHPRIRTALPTNIHFGRSRLVRPRSVDQPLLDVAGQRVESLVDVDVALGRDLQEGDTEFVGESLALFCGDGALLFPVAFVANEDLVDAFGGVLLDVGEPCADVCVLVSAFLPTLSVTITPGNVRCEWATYC
jgi:hypothetical protein